MARASERLEVAEDHEQSFGKIALEKGYCAQAQMEDALHTLEEVRKLGLDEQLGNILVKKKILSTDQVRAILKIQGQRTKIKIDGYDILEKVGQGGMGAVFKARQISLDRVVALKILPPKLAADHAFCERFVKEARAVAKLSHPNIIVGIDVGRCGKFYYFAMEFVEGETALRLLRDRGPFSEAQALKICLQIARALEHAHKHGMVHRDVKPDNIMVTPREEAKLCDLGLAKRIETGAEASQTGVAVGTPHYISPEQARGESNVDITADIYSLGATLYHLTTGLTLFQGKNSTAIMTQHLTAEAPNARKLRPELTEGFCLLLEKMLAKAPKERYTAPTELIEELEGLLEKKPPARPLAPLAKSSMARTVTSQTLRTGGRATTGPQSPVGPRGTTGPRAPVGRGDATTGLVGPLDRPEPTTGPKLAVGPPKILILAGVTIALGVVAGAAMLLGGPAAGRPGAGQRADLEPSKPALHVAQPASSDPASGQPAAKFPDKGDAPATAPSSGWEALDKARQALREKPGDFATVLGLYKAAEKDAPPEVLDAIHSEAADVSLKAFHAYLDGRMKEALLKLEAKDYARALDMLQAADFPAVLMNSANKQELGKARQPLEARALEDFKQSVLPMLQRELKSANNAAKLAALKGKLEPYQKAYPAPAVSEILKNMTKDIDGRLREEEARELIAKVRALGKELASLKLNAEQIAAKRQTMKTLVTKLMSEYANTEAYREEKKK